MDKKGLIALGFNPYFILIALAFVGLYFVANSEFLAIGFDDYLIEDDFSIPSPALTGVSCSTTADGSNIKNCQDSSWKAVLPFNNAAATSATVYNGDLVLSSFANNPEITNVVLPAAVVYKKNLKNRDIKLTARLMAGTSDSGLTAGFTLYNDATNRDLYTKSVSVSGGGKGVGLPTEEYLVELIKDFENPDLFHVVINGFEREKVIIEGDELMLGIRLTGSGADNVDLAINELKSRAYFNCEVEADEVVVRDTFNEGSTFSYADLTYIPVKFCVDSYPAIKRSFVEGGVRADILGQVTKKITTGQSVTVGTNEVMEIYYIADYKEGMGQQCPIDSAFDTKTKKCERIVFEEDDVVEIIKEKVFIEVGNNEKFFKDTLKIDGKMISAGTLQFLCADEEITKAIAPDPQPECWQATVDYSGETFKFVYAEEKDIDQFFQLKYLPSAQYKESSVHDVVHNFVLTMKNRNILEMSLLEEGPEYYLLFGKPAQLRFTVVNNYGNFDDSGVQIRETRDLLTQQSTTIETIPFTQGKAEYSIDLGTNEYGQVQYELVPFIRIGGEIFFDDEKIIRSFEVVNEIPEGQNIVVKSQQQEEKSFFQKVIDFLRNLVRF